MLVIISDLHLTDGTTADTITEHAFTLFRGRLQDLAQQASFRAPDGRYQPITRIDLVLLGDVLDVVRSTYWNQVPANEARPWNDLQDPLARSNLVQAVDHIAEEILRENEATFKILRGLSGEDKIKIPPADAAGNPAHNQKYVEVATNIYYMTGNHDWFWHVPGEDFEAIRAKIVAAMGLANPPGPFAHDPGESTVITEIFKEHKVMARHGDIYDPFNYNPRGRDFASLGDAIVIDIINGFPFEVMEQLKGRLPESFRTELVEIGNVRPRLLAPVWLQNQIERHQVDDESAKEMRRIWNELTDNMFEKNEFVRQHDTFSPFDLVDLMQTVLNFSKLLSFQSITDLVSYIQKKIWGGDSSFAKNVAEEAAYQNNTANYFIYGHTHHYETVPLDVGEMQEPPYERWYFNSGTWHPLYDQALLGDKEFIRHKVFTYLAFYTGDERKGRKYETWSGTLFDTV